MDTLGGLSLVETAGVIAALAGGLAGLLYFFGRARALVRRLIQLVRMLDAGMDLIQRELDPDATDEGSLKEDVTVIAKQLGMTQREYDKLRRDVDNLDRRVTVLEKGPRR